MIDFNSGHRKKARWPRRPSRVSPTRVLWLLLGLGFAGLGGAALSRSGPEWQPSVIRLPTSTTKLGTLIGRASVIDGDTIRLQGESVRFQGIDAPESRQTCKDASGASYACGRISANALDDFLAQSRPTRCDVSGKDRYGRAIARCFRADGADVSAWLVRSGLALDWPTFSKGLYAADQDVARARRTGIWRGPFEAPWDWRKLHSGR